MAMMQAFRPPVKSAQLSLLNSAPNACHGATHKALELRSHTGGRIRQRCVWLFDMQSSTIAQDLRGDWSLDSLSLAARAAEDDEVNEDEATGPRRLVSGPSSVKAATTSWGDDLV